MIYYTQKTGEISEGPTILGQGYSGNGPGLNNPDMEGTPDVGPIPRGLWQIAAWHDTYEDKGPCVAQLAPVAPFDALGRAGFLIHGDNAAMDQSASHGCIIASREIREALRASGDTQLEVE